MDLDDRRVLVAGATGALGSRLAHALAGAGARVCVAGRDEERLAKLAQALDAPAVALDLADPGAAVAAAAEALGGLDGLVVATGAVAFGPAADTDDATSRALLDVNALGPIGLIRATLPQLDDGGLIVALSAVVADHPTAGMAAYSASKAALSGYLAALRRELRRDGVQVLDVRPPHLDTAFSEHALAGEPPRLPEPHDADALVERILDAVRDGRRELRYDPMKRELLAD